MAQNGNNDIVMSVHNREIITTASKYMDAHKTGIIHTTLSWEKGDEAERMQTVTEIITGTPLCG